MTEQPRLFHLQRDHDVSGVSGTGRVANGVLWPDGAVSLRWIGDRPSTVHWDRLADAEHVHGHGGATRIVWADQVPPAARPAVLREAAEELGRMDYDADSNDYGYDTYRDAWNGGVMDGAEKLRRMADETAATETGPVDQATVGRALDALRAGNHITARRLLEAATAAVARQDGAQP